MTSESIGGSFDVEDLQAISDDEYPDDDASPLPNQITPVTSTPGTADAPLSKNQQKKLLRKQQWEAGREDRKAKRKEKMKLKKEKLWAAKREAAVTGDATAPDVGDENGERSGRPAGGKNGSNKGQGVDGFRKPKGPAPSKQLPITIIFDCQFDDLMTEGELISLVSQLTRCYSDNRKARFRAHMAISSYGGRLQERFETVLENHHKNWKGVRFLEEDWITTAEQAAKWMKEPGGGVVAGALPKAAPTVESPGTAGEVVYLSSDSPETLTELKPYSTYIIGGLVDRNRHKGICYKRALDANVRTAKLPIGDYLQMSTRSVLATNHVCEIMVKWFELGDWAKAFMEVIPKRKGVSLKGENKDVESAAQEEQDDQDELSMILDKKVKNGEQEFTLHSNGDTKTEAEDLNLKRKHENSNESVLDALNVKRVKEKKGT